MICSQALHHSLTVGIAVGLSGAWALTRVAALRFYGLGNTDPLTLTAVSVLLAVVAVLASYIPASRALRVLAIDPNFAEAHLYRAVAYYNLGKLERGETFAKDRREKRRG